MLTAVVALAFTAWLVGVQAVDVRRDSASRQPPAVRLTTAALGSFTVLLLAPRLLDLLT